MNLATDIGVVAALVAGIVTIMKSLRGQDKQLHEIHVLVNARFTTALRVIVRQAKKEADRTGDRGDIEVYEQALAELVKAEKSAASVAPA